MEWVETTARSVEEAKDAALDELGVDEQEAEFEIVDEPRAGLFGRVRGEARVRARVAPKQPRPRQEGRGRGPRGDSSSKSPSGRPAAAQPAVAGTDASTAGRAQLGPEDSQAPLRARPGRPAREPRSRAPGTNTAPRGSGGPEDRETRRLDDTIVTAEEQAEIIGGFLDGLLVAFDLKGEVRQTKPDDDTVELDLQGDDLGLLIGPKGQTLTALHELSRTVLQRQATGRYEGRVRIDVSGYRSKRREALARFVAQIAEEVRGSGAQKALEPMNSADRKVVHDAVNDIDGVATRSDGQEPHRRVVIVPDPSE